MKNKVFYTESQSFLSWWLCCILIVVSIGHISLYWSAIQQWDFGPLLGSPGFWINTTMWILMGVLRLNTTIGEEGVEIYFFPFSFYKKRLIWEDIKSITIGEYNPIREYGGWGARWGLKGWAFSARGSRGAKFHMNDGSMVLVGTQKPEEMEQLNLNELLEKHEI